MAFWSNSKKPYITDVSNNGQPDYFFSLNERNQIPSDSPLAKGENNSPFPLLAKRGLQTIYPQGSTDLWVKISLEKGEEGI